MEATILTIGDELLIGQVIDTNSAWLASQLNELGITVKTRFSVGDNTDEIRDAIFYATEQSSVVITTGGLGPTSDDLTCEVLCNVFDSELVENQEVLEHIAGFFAQRNLPLTEVNKRQALVPDRAKVLFNHLGTAPGLYFEDASAHIFVLPGVPFEMKDMFTREVLPILKSFTGSGKLIHQNIVVSGIGESFLSDLIQPWEQNLPEDVSLAYLPSPGLIRLRLSAFTKSEKAGRGKLQLLFDALRPLIKDYFVSDRDEKLSETLLRELLKAHKTVSTAESCTGGYIAHQLTSVPGSSGAYLGSVIAYSNDVKTNILQVKEETLNKFGAVSAETVKEMAENARRLLKTDFSIAVSGIAGPDGGTDEKPVGLVYIAVASAKETTVEEFRFGGFRETNIARSGVAAMNMCIKALRKERK